MGIFGGSKSQQSSQQTSQQGSQQESMQRSDSSSQQGSHAASSTDNQAFPYLQSQYSGQVSNGTHATDLISSLLGLNGGTAGHDAFDTYRGSTGYQSALDQGTKSVTGNAALHGLLGSGSTAKALYKFGASLNDQYFGNYIQQLLGLSGQGLNAGQLIGSAGSRNSSTSDSFGNSTSSSMGASSGSSFGMGQGTSQGTSVTNPDLSKAIGSAMMMAA